MRKIVSLIVVCLVAMPAFAAAPETTARGGRSVVSQMAQARRMASMPTGAIGGNMQITAPNNNVQNPPKPDDNVPDTPDNDKPDVPDTPVQPDVDMREKERTACLNNNIGVGNTFVWASRYSNVNNYASMVEDVEEPANNTCFVKVEVKSNDPKVSVYDIPSKYFEMGRSITCASWANEETLRQRILDAKKTARVWGTVGGAVGGAGIGVGMMELFGNKLIGGKVMGQKDLEGNELLKSQMLVLKEKNRTGYAEFVRTACEFIDACSDEVWQTADAPDACVKNMANYKSLLNMINEDCI